MSKISSNEERHQKKRSYLSYEPRKTYLDSFLSVGPAQDTPGEIKVTYIQSAPEVEPVRSAPPVEDTCFIWLEDDEGYVALENGFALELETCP